jgi:hypothetical protein
MTYTFPISDLILMMLGTLCFAIGRTIRFASAPAITAILTPIVESAKAENDDEEEEEDDKDDKDILPPL